MKEAEAEDVDMLIEGGVLPMLAKVYEDHTDKIPEAEPVAIQPKLDGGRMIAVVDGYGKVTLWTRTRKRIKSMDHVVESLEYFAEKFGWANITLDGEAYHDSIHTTLETTFKVAIPEGTVESSDKDINFENLMSAFRKNHTTEASRKLQYHIYDCVEYSPFPVRSAWLHKIDQANDPIVKVVNTLYVTGEEAIFAQHKKNIKDGYEGSMIRLLTKEYEHKRSDELQKLKNFMDSEFKIVGWLS